jgi:hypothetical protein
MIFLNFRPSTLHQVSNMIRHVIVLFVAFIAKSADMFAQTPASMLQPPLCWNSRPLPECRAWIVSEFSAEKGIFGTHGRRTEMDFAHAIGITLGRMTNTSPVAARGITGTVYLAEQGPAFRAESRHRRWKSRSSALEWSAGLAAQPFTAGANDWGIGLTGSGTAYYDWIGVSTRADLQYGDRRPTAGASVGLRVGGRVGAVGAAVLLTAVGTLIVVLTAAE